MPLNVLPFQFPGIPGVRCAFTGRIFGNLSLDLAAREDDPVLWEKTVQARASVPELLGVEAFAEVHQVHGVRTIAEPLAQESDKASPVEGDGMMTSSPGLALMVKTADCQPILVAHESGRFVMAVHSGWKGNRQDYPRLAVLEFCERYDVRPSELWAVRGPSLGPAASEFVNFSSEWGEGFSRWYDENRMTMDLWGLARHQLSSAGIPARQILSLDLCTYDNAEHFFSYRQYRRNGIRDGRQGSFIWIR